MTDLPDFASTLAVAKGTLEAPELAECHGVACGLLCRIPDSNVSAFIDLLALLELVSEPAAGLVTALEKLLNSSRRQLADEEFSLSLWLPGDDEILEERTLALGQWCSGFLAGIGSGGDDNLVAMSDASREALADLQQIARAEVTDTTESEEDEGAFVEIVEYIRVVILTIREDLRDRKSNGYPSS